LMRLKALAPADKPPVAPGALFGSPQASSRVWNVAESMS
jgi:hypothetical protein